MTSPSPGILARWYGTPMEADKARALLRRSLSPRARRGPYGRALCRLVARFWLNQACSDSFQQLLQVYPDNRHAQALAHLVYGQLLMSRRLEGAQQRLAEGFRVGSHLFSPHDYFEVNRRHQLLVALPLSPSPLPPEGLDGLLATAQVVGRLRKSQGRKVPAEAVATVHKHHFI